MILETIKKRFDELQNYAAGLSKDAEKYEEQLWAAQAALRATRDEIALCELLLSVGTGLSTGTPSAITPKAVESKASSCASETYANPDILVSRWKNGDLKTVVLNVLKREPKRWFKPCEILGEIAMQHKRIAHSGSMTTVLGKLLGDRVIQQRNGKYNLWVTHW